MTEVIYTGRRLFKSGVASGFIMPELLQPFIGSDAKYPPTRDRIEAATSFFKTAKRLDFTIGGVYEIENVEIAENGRISKMGFNGKFLKMGGHEFLAGWQEADQAISREKQTKSIIAKAEKNTSLARAIEILKFQYANVAPAYRRSFELWLLDQISKR